MEHGREETTMANEKVLVVEDRRENLVFLANQILRPGGYEVITARDGQEGLDMRCVRTLI